MIRTIRRGPVRAITREDKPRKPCPIGTGGFISPPGHAPEPAPVDDEDDNSPAPTGVPGGSS